MKTKKHRGLSMIYLCLLFTPEVPVCIELDYFHKKTSYCRHYKETELFSDYKQLNFLKFVIGLYFILFYENNKIQNLIINIDAKKLKIFGETQSLIKEIKIANVKIIDKNIFTSEPLITKGGGTFDYKINVGATNIIDVMSVPTFNNIIRKLGDKLIFRDPTINSRKKYSPELELWFTSHNTAFFNISIEFKKLLKQYAYHRNLYESGGGGEQQTQVFRTFMTPLSNSKKKIFKNSEDFISFIQNIKFRAIGINIDEFTQDQINSIISNIKDFNSEMTYPDFKQLLPNNLLIKNHFAYSERNYTDDITFIYEYLKSLLYGFNNSNTNV